MIHWGSKVHVATVGSSETSVSEKLLLCKTQSTEKQYQPCLTETVLLMQTRLRLLVCIFSNSGINLKSYIR